METAKTRYQLWCMPSERMLMTLSMESRRAKPSQRVVIQRNSVRRRVRPGDGAGRMASIKEILSLQSRDCDGIAAK